MSRERPALLLTVRLETGDSFEVFGPAAGKAAALGREQDGVSYCLFLCAAPADKIDGRVAARLSPDTISDMLGVLREELEANHG